MAKTADNRYIVVVRTGFSQQEVKKCVSALAIKDLRVSRGLHSYQFDGIGPTINMVWIDKTTFLTGTDSPELMFRVMNEEDQLEAIMKRHSQSLSDSEGDCKKIIAAGETMVRELRAAGLSEFIADIPADTMAALEEKYKSDEVSQESEDKCWDRDFLDYSSEQRRNLEEKRRSASQPSP